VVGLAAAAVVLVVAAAVAGSVAEDLDHRAVAVVDSEGTEVSSITE